MPELKGYVPSHQVSPQLNFKTMFKTYHRDHHADATARVKYNDRPVSLLYEAVSGCTVRQSHGYIIRRETAKFVEPCLLLNENAWCCA